MSETLMKSECHWWLPTENSTGQNIAVQPNSTHTPNPSQTTYHAVGCTDCQHQGLAWMSRRPGNGATTERYQRWMNVSVTDTGLPMAASSKPRLGFGCRPEQVNHHWSTDDIHQMIRDDAHRRHTMDVVYKYTVLYHDAYQRRQTAQTHTKKILEIELMVIPHRVHDPQQQAGVTWGSSIWTVHL